MIGGIAVSILKAKNITKIYSSKDILNKVQVLTGIDLNIEPGEFVGIMGPSGSGKTTLLNVVSGLLKPSTGNVEIHGRSIHDFKADELAQFRREKVGFVFQDFNLLDSLTIRENVLLPMVLNKKTRKEIDDKVNETLALFSIEEIGEKYPYNVSGGQQQRAAISRALVNDPDIIFADEPTGNLDSKSAKGVMECFDKLNRAKNKTIMMVTHDAKSASYCQRIIFIKDGAINMELINEGNQSAFFNRILDALALLGGERHEP